jgi:hypothetical protein
MYNAPALAQAYAQPTLLDDIPAWPIWTEWS